MPSKEELSRYFSKIGSKGGKQSAAGMTPKERRDRSRKANAAKKAKAAARRES